MNIISSKILHFYRLLYVFILFFSSSSSFSYNIDINNKRFTHLTIADGLSSNNIFSILKDDSGYLWMGTANGLNRYDGHGFKIYKPDETVSSSITGTIIYDLIADNNADIWISTDNGLNKFEVRTETFKNFSYDNSVSKEQTYDTTYKLLINGDNLWFGSDNGLFSLDLNSYVIKNIFNGHPVYHIELVKDFLWLTSRSKIFRYSLKSGKINEYLLPLPTPIVNIFRHNNILWLGTWEGIIYFDMTTGTFDLENRLLPGIVVNKMIIDNLDNIWIATKNAGLYIYSIPNSKLDKVFTSETDTFYLKSADIFNIMIDNNNHLWIASQAGLSYTSLNHSLYFLRTSSGQLIDNAVSGLMIDNSNALWITSVKGVTRHSNDNISHYKVGSIMGIFISDDLILAYGDSLYQYNKEMDIFEEYNMEGLNFQKYGKKLVRDIIQIEEGQYLLVTWRGLTLWNKNEKTLSIVSFNNRPDLVKRIFKFYKYKNSILLGTAYGLYEFNTGLKTISRYLIESEPTILDKARIFHMVSEINDDLWLSTDKGLFKVKDNQIVARFTANDGLPDTAVNSIAIVENIIWLSTNSGVGAFQHKNDQLKKIHLNNGLFNIEFNAGAVYNSDDYLYFGGMEGVIYFKPKQFIKTATLPPIVITDFYLYNQRISPGTELLPYSIRFVDQLIMDHNQNMLTFEFSSMNYNNPNHLYAYQMEGLTESNDWVFTNTKNRRATFTPPIGDYIFRVKSAWDKNALSDEVTEVKVTILPPWWKSQIAYMCYIIIILISLYVLHRIHIHNIKLRSIALENQVRKRTIEVQQQKEFIENLADQLKVLLDKKDQIFTNISHEFKTPLTLIMSPLKSMLKIASKTEQETILMIQRNTYRLLRLVNQLLDLSKLRARDKFFPSMDNQDVILSNQLVEIILPSFQNLAKSKQIRLHYVTEDIPIKCSYDTLEKIITNLLSNAIKYTLPQGNIELKITTNSSSHCQIIITDNGIGIPQDQLEAVFEPFVRVTGNQYTAQVEGTGVGLSLVKELVDSCNGSVELNSALNKGTTVTVTLPIADERAEMISQNQYINIDKANLEIMDLSNKIQSELIPFEQLPITDNFLSRNDKQLLNQDKPLLLIIEDNPDMRGYLKKLCSPQYDCITASNGIDGVDKAQEFVPDIIISDIMMPGNDGYDVIKTIKDDMRTSHIPVILLSALNDRENRLRGLVERADDYLTKPFDSDELLIRLDNLLTIRNLLKEHFTNNTGSKTGDDLPLVNQKDKFFLDRFNEILENSYKDMTLDLNAMADKLAMSHRQVQRKLKSLTGSNPNEYLRSFRIDKAIILLKKGQRVEDAAYDVGFTTRNYFGACFKAKMGVSPKQYQQNIFNREPVIE